MSQWTATTEDPLCTLEEAFKSVDPSVGFNIEVKFDYIEETSDLELQRVIHCTMEVSIIHQPCNCYSCKFFRFVLCLLTSLIVEGLNYLLCCFWGSQTWRKCFDVLTI